VLRLVACHRSINGEKRRFGSKRVRQVVSDGVCRRRPRV
jgi:hypothetical protein